jgi:GR25 family glycosyltransferase involved in LPS biosynthesis
MELNTAKWRGFYINLDSAARRRGQLEAQLNSLDIYCKYSRYPATDGKMLSPRASSRSPGEIGIFLSHIRLLSDCSQYNEVIHVVEDDAILCDLTAPTIEGAILRSVTDQYDIIFCEMYVPASVGVIGNLNRLYNSVTQNGRHPIETPDQIKIIDVDDLYLFGTTSYIISPRGISRTLAVLNEEWARGPNVPLDRALQYAARSRKLKLGCFFPFVTTVNLQPDQDSSAGRTEAMHDALAQSILRYSFFARREIAAAARPAVDALLRGTAPAPDDATQLQLDVLKYHLLKNGVPGPGGNKTR